MTEPGALAAGSEDRFVEDLHGVVVRQLEADKLVLPALPAVVIKAVALLRSSDPDLAAVARVLEPDPVVTARVLRLANSAALRGRQQVTTIAHAVTRIGGRQLSALLVELSTQRVFASVDPAINRACRQLWEHSLAVALLARSIAQLIEWAGTPAGAEAPETAYTAGLLHDVGKPVLAGLLLDAEKRLRGKQTSSWINPERWIRIVTESQRRVGLALARSWELPDPVVDAIAHAHAYVPGDPLTVGNVVVLANALTKREGLYMGPVAAAAVQDEIEHGRTLFLLSTDTVAQLCAGLAERVKARLA